MANSDKKDNEILKVGFDLDGVLLYNPARIIRPVIYIFKRIFLKNRLKKFYYPKTNLEKFFWTLFHKSSIFIAPGFKEIIKLIKQKKIKAYIITGRFNFLKKDLDQWVNKMQINHIFSGIYHNKKNEQPHLFKEQMLKKLNLDFFVEDNWDIVSHLNLKHKTKIFWIYNIFDRGIKYQYKFPGLNKVIEHLKNNLSFPRRRESI